MVMIMTKYELDQKRWEQTDHTFEGFSNKVTFLAWFYIQNDQQHLGYMESITRKDKTINCNRLRVYANKHITIEPEHYFVDGFPTRFSYEVDWNEVTKYIQVKFTEG